MKGALVSPANSFGWMDGGLDQKISGAHRKYDVDPWAEARERGHTPGGLYDAVQDLVRSRRAWFVARPVQGLTA